ncbi:MAG: MBL fold metallo-hydrolase [Chitinophagaceae bacterium]|nr:MBL fold metallo-hydrolase [Chitinophagaceae bacterium]
MQRRQFIQHSAIIVGALSLSPERCISASQNNPWTITMLTDNLGIFEEKGGTIAFLLSKTGIVVVDAEFPEQSQHLIQALKKKSSQPFKVLINTHHHMDHTSGNISFKGIVEHVLAHQQSKHNQEVMAQKYNSEDQQLYPDQVYTNEHHFSFDNEQISLHYFGAAHTDGDSFIHFQHANIVHCGDLVFNRRHPYIDHGAGASMKNWINVLNKGLDFFDQKTTFIFGHAGNGFPAKGTAEDVKAFRDFLGNVFQFVEKEIKNGKTKEEILQTTIIPGGEEWKSDGIQRPLTAAWEELNAS